MNVTDMWDSIVRLKDERRDLLQKARTRTLEIRKLEEQIVEQSMDTTTVPVSDDCTIHIKTFNSYTSLSRKSLIELCTQFYSEHHPEKSNTEHRLAGEMQAKWLWLNRKSVSKTKLVSKRGSTKRQLSDSE